MKNMQAYIQAIINLGMYIKGGGGTEKKYIYMMNKKL